MGDISHIQKLSILHCVYQQIASADGSIDEVRDFDAVSLAVNTVGLSLYDWKTGMQQNSHDSFFHLQSLLEEDKVIFRKLLLQVAEMGGHREFRISCANHLFELCGVRSQPTI